MSEQEPRVRVQGPAEVYDFTDAATGVRFVQGRAEKVPLSVARKLAQRKGYAITSVFYETRRSKVSAANERKG